ncbi:uncharacterized protein LOC143292893 [Babylonia areolata]|uniref:uncharacterized protein LOC143292893 n=1 Tax=Babylonia areolata TaxID=304850 RepID=UPI003FD19866
MAPTKRENAKKLKDKFTLLRSNALKCGVNDKQLSDLMKTKGQPVPTNETRMEKFQKYLKDPGHRLHILVILLAVSVGCSVACYELMFDYVVTTPCLVDNNLFSDELWRPKVDCNMCRNVVDVPEEWDISSDKFYEKYAFTGRPVLIKEAVLNWTAMSHFSFKFFQTLYRGIEGSLDTIKEDCQFFGYETEFVTLADALNMSDERAAFQPGEKPWYIGWSNCHAEVGKVLRKHYQRPYFLPDDSESVAEDWIFMGGPGPGAAMHLDYVERPSWQAQVSGKKTWNLVPSPECEAVCHSFNVTVHKGDIIVLDTNIWYHATFVHPGEISITIGSEFD